MKNLIAFLFSCLLFISAVFQENTASTYFDAASDARGEDYLQADSLIQMAIAQAQYEENDSMLAECYYLAAKIQSDEGFYDEARPYYESAIELTNKLSNSKNLSKYKKRLADNYLDQGDMAKAVELALEAIEIAREIKDDYGLTRSLTGLAEIYRYYDHLDLALQYNQEALEVAKRINDQEDLGRAYSNLSAVLGEMDRNEEAIDSLKKGLSITAPDNLFGQAKLNSNIGYCYRNMGEYEKALEYHRLTLQLKEAAKMDAHKAYTLGAIGRAHLGLGVIDSALYYIHLERDWAIKYQNPHQIRDATIHLADAYEVANDIEKAYYYRNIAEAIDDSLFHAEVEQKALLYQRKYDISLKEKELSEERNKRLEAQTMNLRNLIVLVSLLCVALILIFRLRYRAIKKEQEKELVELKLSGLQAEQKRDKEALKSFTSDLQQKNKAIRILNEQIQEKELLLKKIEESKSEELEQLAEFKILTEEDWTKFKLLFEKVHPNFFQNLNGSNIQFTKGEKRLMALIKLDMGNQEIADVLGISSESVSKSRFRLKKKLDAENISSIEELVHAA